MRTGVFFLTMMVLGIDIYGQTTGSVTVNFSFTSVALIDIEGPKALTLAFAQPGEAGAPLPAVASSSLWLNFTSAVAPSVTRAITVHSSSPNPVGIIFQVRALGPAGFGDGNRGVPGGSITLGASPQVLISGIGGAFTGNGVNSGYQLEYSATIGSQFELLRSGNTNIVVTYTFVDE